MRVAKNVRHGFTIVELLIVIAIIGVLMAVLYPTYRGQQKKARQGTTKVLLKQVAAGIDQYYEDIGEYPATLKDLVKEPADEKARERWRGPYFETKDKEAPKDSFGKPFRYQVTEGAEHPYDLASYGAQEGKGAAKKDLLDVWKI